MAGAFGIASVLQLIFGFLLGPYAVGHLRGSFEEIVDLAKTEGADVIVFDEALSPAQQRN